MLFCFNSFIQLLTAKKHRKGEVQKASGLVILLPNMQVVVTLIPFVLLPLQSLSFSLYPPTIHFPPCSLSLQVTVMFFLSAIPLVSCSCLCWFMITQQLYMELLVASSSHSPSDQTGCSYMRSFISYITSEASFCKNILLKFWDFYLYFFFSRKLPFFPSALSFTWNSDKIKPGILSMWRHSANKEKPEKHFTLIKEIQ